MAQATARYAKTIQQQQGRVYGLSRQPKEGARVWYYLLVDPRKEKRFLTLWNGNKALDLADFGEVIARGFGTAPKELAAQLAAEYDLIVHA